MIASYFGLEGKHVLITGSTRGIGAALAEGFKQVGCTVWVHGKEEEASRKKADALGASFVSGDLSQPAAITRIAETVQQAGRLDILVNNAGVEYRQPFEELDVSLYEQTFDVNVKAPLLLTHQLLPLLKESTSANVLNITSIHQEAPYPKHALYCMSKSALGMLTKCLSLELSPYRIRVNNLAPGAVRTEINQEVVDSMEADFRQWIPLGRVASPQEMIGTALYLCSEAAQYTTGATVYVDGGYTQHLVRY